MEKSQTNATNATLPCRPFEETFENTQQRKWKQFEFVSSRAGNLRIDLKMHAGDKANNAIMPLQAIRDHILKYQKCHKCHKSPKMSPGSNWIADFK